MSLPPSIEALIRKHIEAWPDEPMPNLRNFWQSIAAEACRLQRERDEDYYLVGPQRAPLVVPPIERDT